MRMRRRRCRVAEMQKEKDAYAMMKWKLSAFFGVVFGSEGIVWGYAQAPAPTGFFELRVYTALPGKRDALAARFANRTAAI